jgi:hypothetical protein
MFSSLFAVFLEQAVTPQISFLSITHVVRSIHLIELGASGCEL